MPRGVVTTPNGPPKPGMGRPKGTPNRTTVNARRAIADLVDNNVPRMQKWLDEIAKTQGPDKAWRCMMDVIEFHIPKLARTEVVGANGGPVQGQVEHVIVFRSTETPAIVGDGERDLG